MSLPRLIALDEPSLGLSPILVKEMMQLLLNIRHEMGVSILLVEQNAKMALRIANFGYIMESGRIVLEGTAEALQENEDVQELYLGVGDGDTVSPKGWRLYKKRRTW
jgi:branched-chain amino acid transport system ATP-binding protein